MKPNQNGQKPPNRKTTIWTIAMILIILIGFQLMMYRPKGEQPEIMSYPEFQQQLENGNVDTVYYSDSQEYMTVTFLNEETRGMTPEMRAEYEYDIQDQRLVKYPGYDEFRKDILEHGAICTRITHANLLELFLNLISVSFSLFLMVMLFNMMRKGPMAMMSGGNNEKAMLKTSDVRFKDVIGQDEVIEDLQFIVELMKNPKIGESVGAKIPKGLLLQGPPGTGKTLLAKAVAGEAGVPFIQQSASSFIELYVGMGAKRVRELFQLARKNSPCIIFIDEIDAVGVQRGDMKTTSEHEQTINALLEQMDGFESRDGIFVIAATNRADALDEALIRPGRFDRQVTVNPPQNWQIRQDMFKHYLGQFKMDESIDIENLAKQTPGFTGADIASICNEASIIAVMQKKPAVDMDCIEEAIDKKVFRGNRSKQKQYERDRRIVAYHEAGHAVMTWLCGEPISRASIQSTVSGVGGAVFGADRDGLLMTEQDFRKKVKILYAGRASEEINFDSVTTGASNDITQATGLLIQYIEHMGFDPEFGLLDTSVLTRDHLMNGEAAVQSAAKLSRKLYTECLNELHEHKELITVLAEELLKEETISGTAIDALLKEASQNTTGQA